MVLLNPSEDYYAILELTPNADPNEIKTQFNKLGDAPKQPTVLPSALTASQRDSTTRTAIRAKNISSSRSSIRSNSLTRAYPTQ